MGDTTDVNLALMSIVETVGRWGLTKKPEDCIDRL